MKSRVTYNRSKVGSSTTRLLVAVLRAPRILAALATLACAPLAQAADFYVAMPAPDGIGDDSNPGTSAAPFATISNALEKADAAIAGGAETVTILLADGTYSEHLLYVTNAITITSVSGDRDGVVVDATGLAGTRGSVFRLNHADATLSGITVINGQYAWRGGNIYIDANGGTVTNCVVANGIVERDWSAGYQGGNIYMASASAIVVDCVVTNGDTNSGDYGQGGNIWANSGRISRCLIADGKASAGARSASGGNVCLAGAVVLDNCLLTGGTLRRNDGQGTAIAVDNASARVVNCTIIGNYPKSGATSSAVWLAQAGRVVNCVIYDNGGTKAMEWGNQNAASFYNCAFSAAAEFTGANSTVTNLTEAAFKGYQSGNYAPCLGSPLINSGLSDISSHTALDCSVDRNKYARPAGEPWDIGCYEFTQGDDEIIISVACSTVQALCGETVSFTPAVGGTAGMVTCKWDFDDGGSEVTAAYGPVTHVFLTAGFHYPKLSVSTDGGTTWVASYRMETPIQTAPSVMWVDAACATPVYPYATEATAATNLTDALNVLTNSASGGATAMNGVTVKVKPGTYGGKGYPTIASAIKVLGVGDRDNIVFDAIGLKGSRGGVFRLNHASATLSGITVINGQYAWRGGNIYIDANGGTITNCVVANGIVERDWSAGYQGGNIYMASTSAMVVDCVVTNGDTNSPDYGMGGNIWASGGRISRCVIADGKASTGGGNVCLSGAVIMENCLITGGTLRRTDGNGTAIGVDNASARVVNCTITCNYPKEGASSAGIYLSKAAMVANCVIYGNGGTAATEWGNTNAGSFTNCAFAAEAAYSGTASTVTNLTDAAFRKYAAGDYRPKGSGPLCNAGDNALYTTYGATSTTDLLGQPRILNKVIDIGCYETATSAGLQIYVR